MAGYLSSIESPFSDLLAIQCFDNVREENPLLFSDSSS